MQPDKELRVSLVQQDIVWEDKKANLAYMKEMISFWSGNTDILVFPEMCTTGFTMRSHELAETTTQETITTIKQWANDYNVAICGSFIAEEDGNYYNRAFFISPDTEQYYDKRHLFRMGNESDHFSSGKNRLIIEHKGFRICLLVCYDLRFPVWARNVDNEYDLLIYVANWPESRIDVWNTLLTARAIENMCYVCGVNRFGVDGNGLKYNGSSRLINAKGQELSSIVFAQDIETISISKKELDDFRAKFPVWKDGDKFNLEY